MPYIPLEQRVSLWDGQLPQTAGELNYAISDMVDSYLALKDVSYATINEVIGVLECAKLELYRRIAAPYEDGKRMQNGDAYGCV